MTTVYVTAEQIETLAFRSGLPIEFSADRAHLFLPDVTYVAHLAAVAS